MKDGREQGRLIERDRQREGQRKRGDEKMVERERERKKGKLVMRGRLRAR